MSEPAPELSVEELSQHPDMLGEDFDTSTHGRPLRLVDPDRRQLADVAQPQQPALPGGSPRRTRCLDLRRSRWVPTCT
jgi:hypothetical protein